MLTEATATGRPVAIVRPRVAWRPFGPRLMRLPPISWLVDLGLVPQPRNIAAFCDRLVATGRASYLGEPRAARSAPAPEDMARTVERVRALFRAEA